jgi:hypothetical protein
MSKPIDTREIVTMVEKFIGPSDWIKIHESIRFERFNTNTIP